MQATIWTCDHDDGILKIGNSIILSLNLNLICITKWRIQNNLWKQKYVTLEFKTISTLLYKKDSNKRKYYGTN